MQESLSAFASPAFRLLKSLESLSIRILEKVLKDRGRSHPGESASFFTTLSAIADQNPSAFSPGVASALVDHLSYQLGKMELISALLRERGAARRARHSDFNGSGISISLLVVPEREEIQTVEFSGLTEIWNDSFDSVPDSPEIFLKQSKQSGFFFTPELRMKQEYLSRSARWSESVMEILLTISGSFSSVMDLKGICFT